MIKKFGLPLSSCNFSSAYSFNNLDNLKDYYNFKYSKVDMAEMLIVYLLS